MDFESALSCLRSADIALASCEMQPDSVLELDAAGRLDQLGPAVEALVSCRVTWGAQTEEIKRLASSVSERSARLRLVFSHGDRYCHNRLSISSISFSGYSNPGVTIPLSIPGKFEAEG